ncbi:hypothetical protein ACWEKT_24140 [Nocardia takedensis]
MTTVPASRRSEPVLDWVALADFVVAEIAAAVDGSPHRDAVVAVAITDFHAANMLILWPTISVATGADLRGGDWRPETWRWHRDPTPAGDTWAGLLTTRAGTGGPRWTETVRRFLDVVVAACRRATRELIDAGRVDPRFVAVAIDESADLVTRCLSDDVLRRHFPRLHARHADIERLRAMTTPGRIAVLLDALCSPASTPLDVDTVDRLVIETGVPGAAAVADLLRDRAAQIDPALSRRCFAVIDAVATTRDSVLVTLREILARAPMPVRGLAAASLAWAGRLAVDDLAELTDDLRAAAIGRRYLSPTANGPLDYGLFEAALDRYPHLHDALFEKLSPTSMFAIRGDDIDTARHALSSPWPVVRRHAAIVLLTVHV